MIADAAQFISVELLEKENKVKLTVNSKVVNERTQQVKQLEQQLAQLKKNAPLPAPMAMSAQDRSLSDLSSFSHSI